MSARYKHPWYCTWKYQRKKDQFPWKKDFHAFRRWAESAGYNPGEGDTLRQEMGVDKHGRGFYRIYVQKADGSEGNTEFKVSGGGTTRVESVPHQRILKALRRAHRRIVFKKTGDHDYKIITTETVWVNMMREMGVPDATIEAEFLRPIELQQAETDSEDIYDDMLRELWTRMHDSCYNTESAAFELIGAQGISVEEIWHDFEAFRSWAGTQSVESAIRGPRVKPDRAGRRLTIVRKDRQQNYGPGNCRIV